eukprot:8940785-Pyramimonas_sp.AAC.1
MAASTAPPLDCRNQPAQLSLQKKGLWTCSGVGRFPPSPARGFIRFIAMSSWLTSLSGSVAVSEASQTP